MKLLTVTIPCYNSEDYMSGSIESALAGGDRVEIIIIDDGSKDRTGVIADEYARRYPGIVRVVHQENGGHGEGINQGICLAEGKYFKTLDSDDRLSGDFVRFLDELEAVDRRGGVDLFVTNYYYNHVDGQGNRSIDFSNALPAGRVFSWPETRRFRPDQILMIHAVCFRTELLRSSGLQMPKHTFYEDNYLVYRTLKYTERMYYLNCDLYLYTIGREGQSVQQDILMKRYRHQIAATELCFKAFHLDEIRDRRKLAYLRHEMFILFGIAAVFARLNRTPECDRDLENMWENCRQFDRKWADYFRYRSALRLVCLKGNAGSACVDFFYRLSHIIVRYN